jgi:hypothetical protein
MVDDELHVTRMGERFTTRSGPSYRTETGAVNQMFTVRILRIKLYMQVVQKSIDLILTVIFTCKVTILNLKTNLTSLRVRTYARKKIP